MTVWLLKCWSDGELDTYLFSSFEKAEAFLASRCRYFWEGEGYGPKPSDDVELIDAYYQGLDGIGCRYELNERFLDPETFCGPV